MPRSWISTKVCSSAGDNDIYDWISGKTAVPPEADSPVAAQAPGVSREVLGGRPSPNASPACIARPAAGPGRPARGRRRDGAGRDRPHHRRPGHPARGARRPAAGAAAGRPALLRARARGSGLPGLGLPALRPAVAASRHRGRAAARRWRGSPRRRSPARRRASSSPRSAPCCSACRRAALYAEAATVLRKGADASTSPG